jgi:hypothetical protein
MVRGSGSGPAHGRRTSHSPVCVASCHRFGRVRCGLGGVVAQPAGPAYPVGSLALGPPCAILCCVTFSITLQPAPRFGRLIGATLVGFVSALTGLVVAYATIATPLVSRLVPGAADGGSVGIGLGVWSFSLIAAGALLAAGTNRLALMLALLKRTRSSGGPAMRALRASADGLAVASRVIPGEGRPIPELVIGSFGAAVIHELPPASRVRQGPSGWEMRTSDGWEPIEDPLDAAMRDAERVRRWLAGADLEFVVRVYAALVVSDRVLQRSPTCAVIAPDQIPAWIASLPRQRTLTAGRRARLMALARPNATTSPDARPDW